MTVAAAVLFGVIIGGVAATAVWTWDVPRPLVLTALVAVACLGAAILAAESRTH